MYGMTRATTTLLGAGVAGLLLWLATRIDDGTTGGYWAVYGIIAGAGLTMAFSQLLGGWTKWGWPRISAHVFLLAFVPVLIAAGWVILAHQPHGNWFRGHVLAWSGDIHIRGLVKDLSEYVAVLAFGIGLVFGFTFDTTGPAVDRPRGLRRRRTAVTPTPTPAPVDAHTADEPLSAERREVGTPTATDSTGDETLVAAGSPTPTDGDARRVEIREGGTPIAPQPEPGPRTGEPTER